MPKTSIWAPDAPSMFESQSLVFQPQGGTQDPAFSEEPPVVSDGATGFLATGGFGGVDITIGSGDDGGIVFEAEGGRPTFKAEGTTTPLRESKLTPMFWVLVLLIVLLVGWLVRR